MGPGPPGWDLGEGLTAPPHKKLPVRKPEIRPQIGEEVHYGAKAPLGCNAKEEVINGPYGT
jgi:hypothetical protein